MLSSVGRKEFWIDGLKNRLISGCHALFSVQILVMFGCVSLHCHFVKSVLLILVLIDFFPVGQATQNSELWTDTVPGMSSVRRTGILFWELLKESKCTLKEKAE